MCLLESVNMFFVPFVFLYFRKTLKGAGAGPLTSERNLVRSEKKNEENDIAEFHCAIFTSLSALQMKNALAPASRTCSNKK